MLSSLIQKRMSTTAAAAAGQAHWSLAQQQQQRRQQQQQRRQQQRLRWVVQGVLQRCAALAWQQVQRSCCCHLLEMQL
jgi:hypothetical protein